MEDVPDSSDDLAVGEEVEQSRGTEEDGRAHGEEGEPATSPGDEEEKQEEQEEDATNHQLPMSHKPGRQDLGINIIEGSL